MKKRNKQFVAYLMSVFLLFTHSTAWAAQPVQEEQANPPVLAVSPSEDEEQQETEVEQIPPDGGDRPDGQIEDSVVGDKSKEEINDSQTTGDPIEVEDFAGEDQKSLQLPLENSVERITVTTTLFQEGGFSGEQINPLTATPEELKFEQDLLDRFEYGASKIDVTKYSFSTELVNGTSELAEMYFKVINSNPELFYVTGTVEWGYESGKLMIFPQYRYKSYEASTIKSDYKALLRRIEYEVARSTMSSMEKVLATHDYLIQNTVLMEKAEDEGQHNGVETLVSGKGTRSGYAMAMALILKHFGTTCEYTVSEDMQHAWIRVQIDGNWYHVDASADELIEQGREDSDYVGHCYLLLSDEKMQEEGYLGWNHPEISCVDRYYDDFVWRNGTSRIYDGVMKGYELRDAKIWEYDYATNSQKILIDAPVEQMLVKHRYICYTDGSSIQAFYTSNPSLREKVAEVPEGSMVTEFYNRGDLVCYTISSENGGHPDINGEHWLTWYEEMQLRSYEEVEGELRLFPDVYSAEYSTKIRYTEKFVLMGDFVPSEETAKALEVDVDGDFDVSWEYNRELGQILFSINTAEYIPLYGSDNEITIALGENHLSFRVTTEGTLGILNHHPEGEFWLRLGKAPQTFLLGTKYEDWEREMDPAPIRWDALDPASSRCWLEGEDADAITGFSYEFLPEKETIQVTMSANRTLRSPVELHVELMIDGKWDHYKFLCQTAIQGIALYDYVIGSVGEIDVLYSISYDEPTFSTDSTMPMRSGPLEGARYWLLCIDGKTVPKSKLSQLRIVNETEGLELSTGLLLDGDQEVVTICVTPPENRVTGSFTLSLDGKTQTFYITTEHIPLIYADEACTQLLDQVELPMLGKSTTTIYLKDGVIGDETVDGKPVDWKLFPKTFIFDRGSNVVDRVDAEYMPEHKTIKLTLYRENRPGRRKSFMIHWETKEGVRFSWNFECRLLNDIYLMPFKITEDMAGYGLKEIELNESESDYLLVVDREKRISDFRVVSVFGSSFEAVKTQLAGYPALRISGGGEAMADPQSITLELPTGERSTFPVYIQADTLKVYFDEQLTHQVKSLTLAQGEEITLYARLEAMVPEEDFLYRWSTDDRQTGAYLIREKYQLEENEDGALLKIPIKAGDTAMPWPGKLNLKFFYRDPYMGDDIDIGLPYQVVPADQMAASGIFNLDLASGRMYALNEHSDAAWVRSNIASKDYTCELIGTNGKELADEEFVGTGCRLLLKNAQGNTAKALDVLLYGDCTGDGSINVFDLLAVKSKILGISTLQGVYAEAADTARENEGIDIFDLLVLKSHILGISSIQQNPEKS
ncbi:hypothetical protein H8711_02885 [Clostridiaceae bacterium NSJ-31]|uniref:Dockerin domain-containing protein n=2 Tax=Ligaoa zhengdingensis TaxID=2763658 RepID=A0A926I3Z8_9FIRM|nr:transglutaminase domain-containing protein [Ligaoa zhengdingensis]MBC8545885.1 hypothetical protein [Ligaoa zhengdingensis]